MCLGRLVNEDIYQQLRHFPMPEHRSFAFSQQSSIALVLLFFKPGYLKDDFSFMRQIVDRFFPDQWSICHYTGSYLDLPLVWTREKYPAAYSAFEQINVSFQTKLSEYSCRMNRVDADIQTYLSGTVLNIDFVLENYEKLVHCLREGNCVLKWLLLHTGLPHTAYRDLSANFSQQESFINFLLNLSHFEHQLRSLLIDLLQRQSECWLLNRSQCATKLRKISTFYSEVPSTTSYHSKQLKTWFEDVLKKVEILNRDYAVESGRTLIQILKAMSEIQDLHQVGFLYMKSQFLIVFR